MIHRSVDDKAGPQVTSTSRPPDRAERRALALTVGSTSRVQQRQSARLSKHLLTACQKTNSLLVVFNDDWSELIHVIEHC